MLYRTHSQTWGHCSGEATRLWTCNQKIMTSRSTCDPHTTGTLHTEHSQTFRLIDICWTTICVISLISAARPMRLQHILLHALVKIVELRVPALPLYSGLKYTCIYMFPNIHIYISIVTLHARHTNMSHAAKVSLACHLQS